MPSREQLVAEVWPLAGRLAAGEKVIRWSKRLRKKFKAFLAAEQARSEARTAPG